MIQNFPELIVLLDIYYRKIPAIRTAITYAEWRSDFKKISELKAKEQFIRKKMSRYITFYKTKTADNYLEKLIYGEQLKKLEEYFDNELNNKC